MLNVERLIRVTLFALVLISSLLLGLSLDSFRLIMIAVIGATIGFIVTDVLKIFRIEGILANIASIVILILAMKDFFPEDSTGKLVSVANLLVYLQTVLMFQEKTPRLNWQILVLSLLQVVVGAIFTLNFEAGLLFLLYFFVVGLAMVLQSVYTDTVEMKRLNRKSAGNLFDDPGASPSGHRASPQRSDTPVTFFDPVQHPHPAVIRAMVWHLLLWIGVSALFTSVMFYIVPRHVKPWFGPSNVEVTSTGVSKSVDLDESGLITLSNQLVFRVGFNKVGSRDVVDLEASPPYFRGLALSSLVMEDGKTNWRAPHDRVHNGLYQEIPFQSSSGNAVIQTITLEETADPLVYSSMPFLKTTDTPRGILFCHEVSALARCRLKDKIDLAPYTYQCLTLMDNKGQFSKFWPYISNVSSYTQKPMSNDPPQREWLTQMDPENYPALVSISDILAEEFQNSDLSRIEMLRKYEQYFLEPGRFDYTLDFRQIKRNEGIDPVEDFVRNHRSGHCELFASALTLMLRRQGVPARLVVGFHGAEFNSLTGNYMVRGKHAHAWVEAYLTPEECTQEMKDSGQAGPGGAWMILDATPYSLANRNGNMGDDAIDLARTVWDDYVLGMDGSSNSDDSSFSLPLFQLLQDLNIDKWESELQKATGFTKHPAFKYSVAGFITAFFFLLWLRRRVNSNANTAGEKSKQVSRFRRFVAGAISLVAPGLGQWVRDGSAGNPTAFYQQMLEQLAKQGLRRAPDQTHREFAGEVSARYIDHPFSNLIQSTVREITELFNDVRFGRIELESELSEQIDLSLIELNDALRHQTLIAENKVLTSAPSESNPR